MKPRLRCELNVMTVIESNFIGNFKLGDNINHNLEVLHLLYRHYQDAEIEEQRLLCKPIILLIASIVEAVLYDLHNRIQTFTVEGVQNVAAAAMDAIRLSKIDDFSKYIASAKKRNFFDETNGELYDQLEDLRKLRNRIHIQNEKNHFEPDEIAAFTPERKSVAEMALEKTLRKMATRFPRRHDYVGNFALPWDAHFPD